MIKFDPPAHRAHRRAKSTLKVHQNDNRTRQKNEIERQACLSQRQHQMSIGRPCRAHDQFVAPD